MSSKTNVRDEELAAGQMLGRYELLMPIAKGGMGDVWAARLKGTRGFRKLVAIKTILRTLEHAGLEQMLFQEAMLASQIHHPNVAETLELGEHEGRLYLVMELVSGESLRFILREAHAHEGLPLLVSINVIGQVCRGLAAAHDLRGDDGERVGLVHRDISPPNIMITDAGTVKIVDFGVATTASSAADASGEIKGKISYLAPEQLRGEALDARVDVFATGILLYLLTVGCHPFRTTSESGTIARILSKAPAIAPSVFLEDYPEELEQIVMRALHKDRAQRFQSIAALLEALQNAFPDAFGPRADQAAAACLQGLMKERLLERKATLRMAEELAEKSSPSHGAYSLPVVTFSAAPRAKSHRVALLGVGGAVTGLTAAALAGTLYLQGFKPVLRSEALGARESLAAATGPSSGHAPDLRRAAAHALPGGAEGQAPAETGARAANTLALTIAASPTALSAGNARRSKHAASSRGLDEPTELAAEALSAERLSPSSVPALDVPTAAEPAMPEPPPHAVDASAGRAPQVQVQALAPAPSPSPVLKTAELAPRFVSSKLGQSQLLTNPASAGARVRLPVGLNRMGETFSAVVNICVTAAGRVSKVDILRSAGPALDPQIPSVLSRWHYRPLLEGGRPTPFCYKLNYEISAH